MHLAYIWCEILACVDRPPWLAVLVWSIGCSHPKQPTKKTTNKNTETINMEIRVQGVWLCQLEYKRTSAWNEKEYMRGYRHETKLCLGWWFATNGIPFIRNGMGQYTIITITTTASAPPTITTTTIRSTTIQRNMRKKVRFLFDRIWEPCNIQIEFD